MKKACYAQQMRDIDKAAMEKGAVPGIVLMENAAISVVDELKRDFTDISDKRIAIFCGKGNNGGDGFAIARHLHRTGAHPHVFLVCGNDFSGDAKTNFDIISKMHLDIEALVDTENLDVVIKSYDIIIDAVFGTGIHGIVGGMAAEVIEFINENSKYTLSVDVPSGMNTDTGEICGVCVRADKTVTFAAYKIGMFKYPAADFCGEIVVKDISIPEYIIESQNVKISVTDDEFVRKNMPERKNNSQKGDYGKVLVIAGSRGMTGAAYLSAQSAVMTGSGLVTLAICDELNPVMEVKTTEVMTLPVKGANGHISADAADVIVERLDRFDAVLFGPGLGRSEDIGKILGAILKHSKIPVVIDADGINAAARNMDMLKYSACPVIFTPHAVEMSRLTGYGKDYIEENRFEVSAEFAEKYGASILLKGHHTLVTAPDEIQYINITGNPGLATGGSGDVLAGILVSLAARGTDETTAAAMAAHIHGLAGDFAAAEHGMESVTAAKVMECIPKALCHILQVEKRKKL